VKDHRVIAVPKPRDEIDLPKLARVIIELAKQAATEPQPVDEETADAS
jgi:hypothetical protein